MFHRVTMDCSQAILIDKINQYQQLKGRELIQTEGYCQGLALVWLQKMLEKRVEWFYQTVQNIALLSPEEYDDKGVELEKLLAMIEWAHCSCKYMPTVTQMHLKKILEMRNIESCDFNGTRHELYRNIRPRHHPVMYFIGSEKHAISVFHLGGFYHVYDANYLNGRAKVLDCKKKTADEVIERLGNKAEFEAKGKIDLEFHTIPLRGIMLHPADEVIIDIPDGYDADVDESIDESEQNDMGGACVMM
jgi:hypothetical protein